MQLPAEKNTSTNRGRKKMATVLQMTFQNNFIVCNVLYLSLYFTEVGFQVYNLNDPAFVQMFGAQPLSEANIP